MAIEKVSDLFDLVDLTRAFYREERKPFTWIIILEVNKHEY